MTEEFIFINTLQEVKLLFEYIKDFHYIAFDTETTGIAKNSQIIGFSICCESTIGFYVALYSWDVKQQKLMELETCQFAKEFLSSLSTKKLIMHNAVFDCARVNDIYKIDLMPSVHTDTMILAHIVDENRRVGLKELGTVIFGNTAKAEKEEMEASIKVNGGKTTRNHYELYKADVKLIGKYGAKDAILTFKLFNYLLPQLFDQKLDTFFYGTESMPLLRGPTYQLNTTGLKVDEKKLQTLRSELEAAIISSQAFIDKEIYAYIKDKFPGTTKSNTFNIESNQQLAWLLFDKLGENFSKLTNAGKVVQKSLGIKTTYTMKGQREFIEAVKLCKDCVISTGQKIGDFWKYICCDADSLELYSDKYEWVRSLLEQKKNQKMLSTYVIGLQEKIEYGIIRPSFDQKGTTSGRYSSRNPNFQNLPRDDKRVKSCIIARPGKIFVGADYSQLEPRVFASVSQDTDLLECFRKGEDFYSVVGSKIFGIFDCSLFKDVPGSFAQKHKNLRQIAKAFALATPYGTTAYRQAAVLDKKVEECQDIINKYFEAYPKVELMMLESHAQAKANGIVYNLYGRPRRMPEAKNITKDHSELPYEQRNILNLAMNHRVQSSAASIVNRASIEFYRRINIAGIDAKLVLQIHDELVVECDESEADLTASILKYVMETTTVLPGVDLIANPVIAYNLGSLK